MCSHWRNNTWLHSWARTQITEFPVALKWLPIFEVRRYQYVWNKHIIVWKVPEWFVFTCCDASQNSLRALVCFLIHRNSRIKTVRIHFYGIISVLNSNIMKELTLSYPFSSVVLHFGLKKIKRNTISFKKIFIFFGKIKIQSIKRLEYFFGWKNA